MKICKSYLTKIKKAEYFTLKSDVVSLPCSLHYSFYDYCNLRANSNAFIYFMILMPEYTSGFKFGPVYLVAANSTTNKTVRMSFKFQLLNFQVYLITFCQQKK